MEQLEGRVGVITGAASGIGAAMARRFSRAGMKLVLADIEPEPLKKVADELRASGTEVEAVPTDVSVGAQVDALAEAAEAAFGKVHLLCNNAGVGSGGLIAQLGEDDWSWVLGVNLWGVIHGLRAFLPRMMAHGEPAHVVNTASVAGLMAAPFMGPYNASKFAVVAISETLYHEMGLTGSKVGVSVLCPGWVNTRIHESSRNRPGGGPSGLEGGGMLAAVLASGLPPEKVAEEVHSAVVENRLYILTHPEMTAGIETRMKAIVAGQNPQVGLGELLANRQEQ
ncbi:MAG TPA: SDR family NAD(P)-dependent oxidoreductase [Acidimicrobiales bacterium]|nr:SDR family NAD(P)-dependent oxidoreductase [Acidimicrobiales bacterium]